MLGPKGCLLHKATSPRLGNVTNLPNTRKKHRELGKMRRQRSVFQTKEQDIMSEKELSEVEISNLPKKEFNAIIIKMLTELSKRMDEHSVNFNKELENIKKNYKEESSKA